MCTSMRPARGRRRLSAWELNQLRISPTLLSPTGLGLGDEKPWDLPIAIGSHTHS